MFFNYTSLLIPNNHNKYTVCAALASYIATELLPEWHTNCYAQKI